MTIQTVTLVIFVSELYTIHEIIKTFEWTYGAQTNIHALYPVVESQNYSPSTRCTINKVNIERQFESTTNPCIDQGSVCHRVSRSNQVWLNQPHGDPNLWELKVYRNVTGLVLKKLRESSIPCNNQLARSICRSTGPPRLIGPRMSVQVIWSIAWAVRLFRGRQSLHMSFFRWGSMVIIGRENTKLVALQNLSVSMSAIFISGLQQQ